MFRITAFAVFASALAVAPVASTSAAIISTSGAIEIISPPPSVVTDGLTSDKVIFGFLERLKTVLPSDLSVDANTPGVHAPPIDEMPPTLPFIPAGTKVTSYFFHSDSSLPADSGSEEIFFYVATITFDRDILGIIFNATWLGETDSLLGAPTTAYDTGDGTRGFESGGVCGEDLSDCAEISSDLRTLTLVWGTGTRLDELRVITAVPEPSTLAIISLGLAGLAFTRRRKQ